MRLDLEAILKVDGQWIDSVDTELALLSQIEDADAGRALMRTLAKHLNMLRVPHEDNPRRDDEVIENDWVWQGGQIANTKQVMSIATQAVELRKRIRKETRT